MKKERFLYEISNFWGPHNRFAIKEKDRIWWIGRK